MELDTEGLRTVHIKLSDEEIAEIDAWRKKNHFRSRSEAIRQMTRIVLGSAGTPSPNTGMAEKERNNYMGFAKVPVQDGSDNKALKELIREVIREELESINDKKGR